MNIESKKKAQLPPMETKPSSEDILNAILPPREWVETGIKITIKSHDYNRKALHLIREPLTCLKSGCCSSQRDARLEIDGEISKGKRNMPR